MRVSDATLGGGLVIFAIALAGYSQTFPDIPGQSYGAALFPTLVALGFAGCGVTLIVQGAGRGEPLLVRADWAREPRAMLAVSGTVLGMAAYIVLAPEIGFVPTMVALLMILFALTRVRWWVALPLALVATLAIEKVFADLLLVPLPLGLMPRLPW